MSRVRACLQVPLRSRSLTPTGRGSASPSPAAKCVGQLGSGGRRSSLQTPPLQPAAPRPLWLRPGGAGGAPSRLRERRGSDVPPAALLFGPAVRAATPRWKRSVCATPTLLVTPGSPPEQVPPTLPANAAHPARDAFCRSLVAPLSIQQPPGVSQPPRPFITDPSLVVNASHFVQVPKTSPKNTNILAAAVRSSATAGAWHVEAKSPLEVTSPPGTCSLKFDTPERSEVTEHGLATHPHVSVLGKGTFGTVVLARRRGRTIAVKLVRNSAGCAAGELLALDLRHRHLLAVLAVHGLRDTYRAVEMEYCGCVTLQRLLELAGAPPPRATVARHLRQLTAALAYCHAEGVLHLDVKPANVMVASCGDLKLTDFGSARRVGGQGGAAGPVRGTVPYMAPELFRGVQPTCAADVYSLGVCAWQMLTGHSPFCGLQPETVIYMVVARRRRPEPAVVATAGRWQWVVERCWAQQPADRPTTAQLAGWLSAVDHAGNWIEK